LSYTRKVRARRYRELSKIVAANSSMSGAPISDVFPIRGEYRYSSCQRGDVAQDQTVKHRCLASELGDRRGGRQCLGRLAPAPLRFRAAESKGVAMEFASRGSTVTWRRCSALKSLPLPIMSELSESDPTLVERVRKLLDKAARTDNQHESEMFARKAAELVARHRIDPDRLGARTLPDDLSLLEIVVGRGAYVRGRISLLNHIADSHDVRMVFQATTTGTVATLAGRREDLSVVEVMYASLHQQVAAKMSDIRSTTGAATQRQRRAFLFGFADRIGEMLAETRAAVEAAAVGSGPASNELVLRARRERIDDFAKESWGRVRSAPRPSAVAPDGFARGVAAADNADVGRARLAGHKSLGRGR